MKVQPIHTPIVHVGDDLFAFLGSNISALPERSVLVITSKVVALCERAVAERTTGEKPEKWDVVRGEAELYTEPSDSAYQLMLTVRHQVLAVNAGLDESNADGTYVLLPPKPYESAARIWQFLRDRFGVKELGVIIVDSKTFPLKWGTIGTALAHCGIEPVNDRRGEKDLFGHEMIVTKENVVEALAVAANFEMGEVAEAQPLCLITDLTKVVFTQQPPTAEDIAELTIDIADDAYAPILLKAEWQRGGNFKPTEYKKEPSEL